MESSTTFIRPEKGAELDLTIDALAYGGCFVPMPFGRLLRRALCAIASGDFCGASPSEFEWHSVPSHFTKVYIQK